MQVVQSGIVQVVRQATTVKAKLQGSWKLWYLNGAVVGLMINASKAASILADRRKEPDTTILPLHIKIPFLLQVATGAFAATSALKYSSEPDGFATLRFTKP